MRRLIATLLAAVLTVALVLVSSPADAATDRTDVSFTSGGLTSRYHVYEPAAPTGVLLQFHGDGAYEFRNPTSSYSLGGSNGIVAQARARGYVVVPVLAPDTRGDITWWEDGARNAAYVRDLVDHLTRQGYPTDRLVLVGYSGGAQFITQFLLPLYSAELAPDGAVVFGGGGRPYNITPAPFATDLKMSLWMHWYTGADDDGTRSDDGYDAIGDRVHGARAGLAWYQGQGFTRLSSEWPPGVRHDLDGRFGRVVAEQLDQHPASVPSATPSMTPSVPPAATPSPSSSPTVTKPPRHRHHADHWRHLRHHHRR